MKMGESEVIEHIEDALNQCAATNLPQQLSLETNRGRMVILIAMVHDANFLPKMRDADTLPEMQSPNP